MVDTDRNRKLLTSALMLVGVLAFPLACQEVQPLRGCEGSAANCGDPEKFLCVQDQCVRQDPCGAGVFRFNGRGGSEAPYIAENLPEADRESDDDILVRQVFSTAQLNEGIRPPTFDGEAMLLPADGARYPMRFEVDFYDAADVKNSEERIIARNGQFLGVYAEAKLSLDEGALECSAYMGLWASASVYAKFCIGGENKLYIDQGERQQVPVPLDALTDFDTQAEHIYRLEILPRDDGDGNIGYQVNFKVDGIQVLTTDSQEFTVPSDRPSRFVLYEFGTENTGGSRWDYVRWGCNPDGGPCYIGLLGDDDANCSDLRNSGGAIRCPGGRGVAEEICDNLDNNCDGQRDEIFYKAFGPTARLLDNPLDPTNPTARLELGESCTIGACTESLVKCHPTDPLSLFCDPQAHFAARGLTTPPPEVCNGVDDDCDSVVDEDYKSPSADRTDSGSKRYVDPVDLPPGRSEPTAEDIDANGLPLGATCGVGACQGGVVECDEETGKSRCSNPPLPSTEEECGNNLDDDCDGKVDEGQDTNGDGIIDVEGDKDGDGYQACNCNAAGRATECDPTVEVDCNDANRDINPGAAELCNDVDDNCNGFVDEGFDLDGDGFWSCPRVCPPESCTEGTDCCRQGPGGDLLIANNQDCLDQRNNELATSVFPGAEEVCNNEDDDCDDKIDEGNGPDDPGFVNNPSGDNPIARGYFTAAHCGRCGNDCATAEDRQGKNFRNQCERIDGLYECSTQCAAGFFDANANDADGCECQPRDYANCGDGDAEFGIASATGCVEACDGFDNDCDGRIDEGAPLSQAVIDVLREGGQRADLNQLQLVTRPCFTGGANLVVDQPGARCRTGRMSCVGGEQVGGRADQCLGQVLPLVREDGSVGEICNGIDDDCDGQVDEDTPRDGEACAVPGARGVCADGQFACVNGNEVCVARFQAAAVEICNLVDDDCNGRVDEGFDEDADGFRTCGGVEACRPGVQPTTAGGLVDCNDDDNDPFNNCICPDDCNDDPDIGSGINRTKSEACNGVDDNCDGNVDEDFVRLDATGRPVLRNGERVYSESTLHCSACGNNCEDLPNILPGTTGCVDDGFSGACTFQCLPNYEDRDGDWRNGCETAQCTVDTVGQQKVDLLGRACLKPIYEDPNPDDNIDVCACQGNYRCVEVADAQFDVKCVADPSNANQEEDQVSVAYCEAAVGDRSQIRNDRQEICDSFDNDCDGRIDEDFKDDREFYSTIEHCGVCNNPCEAESASPRCLRGVCTLDQADCAENFYDINGELADGCEYFCRKVQQNDSICNNADDDCDGLVDEDVAFAVDLRHCGSCNNECSFANAFPVCDNGTCAIDRSDNGPNTEGCQGGFADCDDELFNGCEVEIRSDIRNCGACGLACDGAGADACSGGVCTCGARGACNDDQRPICDPDADNVGDACVECLADDDCAANPLYAGAGREFCINKTCRECTPADSTGCVGEGPEPICDRTTQTCRGCQNDAQCTVLFAERPVCVTDNQSPDLGQCVLCNPATNAGCGGVEPTCERSAEGLYSCRACQNDADCGGNRTCIAGEGRCSGCNLQTNEGCSNPTPICRVLPTGGEGCSICQNSEECEAGEECVEGSCRSCNPQTHEGCAANQLCCNFECVDTSDLNGCEVCGVACDATASRQCENRECVCGAAGTGACGGATPFCDDGNERCVSCRDDGDCPPGPRPLCVPTLINGQPLPQCQECDPETNRGCDPNSNNPVCDAQRYFCRPCSGDGECNEAGQGQCVASGACKLCDPDDNEGCDAAAASVCNGQFQCVSCGGAADCADNPNGNRCVAGVCTGCEGVDADSDCLAHPAGNVCLDSVAGAARRCGPCDAAQTGQGGVEDCDDPRNQGDVEGHPVGNICRANSCAACQQDLDCAVGNPAEPYCFQQRCQACDPDGDAPCSGATPVCDPTTFTCVACQGDQECNDGKLCVDEACEACNVGDNSGCDAESPICRGDPPRCRPCIADAECAADPNAAGDFCFEGQCQPCNPDTGAGCQADSTTPVCSAQFVCVGCGGDDAKCASNPDNGGQCLGNGSCGVCDPTNDDGCGADQLCCGVNNAATCQATSGQAGGQCESCGQACDPQVANTCSGRSCICAGEQGPCPANEYCGANGCVECLLDAHCPGAAVCNQQTNTCQTCRPGTHEGCGDQELCCDNGNGLTCVPTGAGPNDSCGACGSSCDQARTNRCIDRACVCGTDPACNAPSPHCDDALGNDGADATCVECNVDADCQGTEQCVGNACQLCDPLDNAGCDPDGTTPICEQSNQGVLSCVACGNDTDCQGVADAGDICINTGNPPNRGACVECEVGGDCASGVCVGNVCQGANCNDNAQNGDETDTDCGGPDCPACADGLDCGQASDCASGVCTGGVCQAPTCNDTVKNGDETDTDCGGNTCNACADNAACLLPGDCASGVCTANVCQAPTCLDSVKNGNETDTDCGGPDCAVCGDGLDCSDGGDCASGVCTANVCQAPTCADGVKNGDETDTDCGGSCDGCALGEACAGDDNNCGVAAPVCLNDVCVVCNPAGHGGCGANELCCGAGVAATCQATDPATQCVACNTACGANLADSCTNRACTCGATPECDQAGETCQAGVCAP